MTHLICDHALKHIIEALKSTDVDRHVRLTRYMWVRPDELAAVLEEAQKWRLTLAVHSDPEDDGAL